MPAFSGLFDGEHGDTYASLPKADAQPPFQRGIVRVLMQGRSMHGHVTALGRNAPATITQVNADRGTIAVPGTFSWPSRATARDVNVDNIDPGYSAETVARVPNATAADLAQTYDTLLRNGHPEDAAQSGVTSQAVTEVISDGT